MYNLKQVPKYSGKEIREIRESIEIPRNVMADILGVSVRTIEKWEIDGAEPNGSARRLLQLLANNPEAIITNIENMSVSS